MHTTEMAGKSLRNAEKLIINYPCHKHERLKIVHTTLIIQTITIASANFATLLQLTDFTTNGHPLSKWDKKFQGLWEAMCFNVCAMYPTEIKETRTEKFNLTFRSYNNSQ